MKDVHLIKAAQAAPIVSALEGIGAPVERLSAQAGMSLDAVQARHGVIGERSLWRFIEYSAAHEGYRLLGYDSAQLNPITSLGEIGGFRMRLAPTLKMLLEYFIADIQSESTGTLYSLRSDGNGTWFRRLQMFGKSGASWQAEQYVIAMVIQIIRICAGRNWKPPIIRISSVDQPQRLPNEWSQTKIEWGCEATEIRIPHTVIALPPILLTHSSSDSQMRQFGSRNSPLQFVDLVETQVRGRRVSLADAAEETGVSTATLKRRLRRLKMSYTDIVEQVRFDLARRMLQDSDTPIAEIAIDLGYEHHANFSRAFKRMSGLSPLTYREQYKSLISTKS